MGLERIAVQRGTRSIRLGTGANQLEVMRLYETAGYRLIPCFGDSLSDPRSRSFEKVLAP